MDEGIDVQAKSGRAEVPKTEDENTKEILECIDVSVIGSTTDESSDNIPEQTNGDGDGISNEQPTWLEETTENGDKDDEQIPTKTKVIKSVKSKIMKKRIKRTITNHHLKM